MVHVKNVRPLAGLVVLEPIDITDTGGLALPDSSAKENLRGKVVAVGGTLLNEHGVTIPCPVQVGEIVVYRKYNEQEIEVDWKKFTLVKFADLLGVVESN